MRFFCLRDSCRMALRQLQQGRGFAQSPGDRDCRVFNHGQVEQSLHGSGDFLSGRVDPQQPLAAEHRNGACSIGQLRRVAFERRASKPVLVRA